MRFVKLPSGKFLNLDQVLAMSPTIGAVSLLTAAGAGFDLVHDDAKALLVYLDEKADLATIIPRAQTFGETSGGVN